MIDLQDDYGNPLTLSESITMEMPAEMLGNASVLNGQSEVYLWSMNPDTGLWEEESPIFIVPRPQASNRKKRRTDVGVGYGDYIAVTEIHGIEVSFKYRNLDLRRSETCISKIRVYDNADTAQLTHARVDVITHGPPTAVSRFLSAGNGNGWNGYCVSAPCNRAGASIAVTWNNAEMTPLSPNEAIAAGTLTQQLIDSIAYKISDRNPNVIEVTMDKNAPGVGNTGPFYRIDGNKWRDSTACVNAMTGHDHHYFRFKQPSVECGDPPDPYTNTAYRADTCDMAKYQLWLPLRHNHARLFRGEFRAYYIKVAVPSDQLYTVEVTSFIADRNHRNTALIGQPYGTRKGCNSNSGRFDSAVCLEVRHPQDSHCGTLADDDYAETNTRIRVKVTSHQYMKVVRVDSSITTAEASDRSTFVMKLERINYGQEYGIYQGTSDRSIEQARMRALNSCKNARDGKYDESTATQGINHAVRFEGYDPVKRAKIRGRSRGRRRSRGRGWWFW